MIRVKNTFPRPIREIENTWIPMSDGARLAARIWLPEDAAENPVPAILEYLPYRKNDDTAFRDATRHPYFAGHGYAAVRVDMRGCGDSDGILYDEYLPQEQDDALEVLAWLAGQPWCTGDVGIIGISWGGFNGLQIAARRPPQLKAVISLCSTDDRYTDDVHYMGGCLLGIEMLPWASSMLAYNARPPDPRFVGPRWREMWLERMEQSPPFIEGWLSHQRRDAYWQHGSVCENYEAITCAVYAVGGWADGYSNAIPRLLAGLSCPRKGLIGPWSHNYPERGVPGPAIGFLQECLRWWDYWLKGVDTGIMDEPMLRAWLQESQPPDIYRPEWPGRWVAEAQWPSPTIGRQSLWLGPGESLSDEPPAESWVTHQGDQRTGRDAGIWCPVGDPADFPGDQRGEDGRSLCFTSAPLAEPLEILGFPEVTLKLVVDQPNALLAVRLCDVAPSGVSTLVTRGLLNLTHRDSHTEPSPMQAGQTNGVSLKLNAVGYAIPAGHRWRLAISTTYWPHAWPSPLPVTLRLAAGRDSFLSLPVRPPRSEDARLAPFEPPESAAGLAVEVLRPGQRRWLIEEEAVTGPLAISDTHDHGRRLILGSDLIYDETSKDTYTITAGQPQSATVTCERSITIERDEWRTRVETLSTMTGDAHTFRVTNNLHGYEDGVRIFSKSWTFSAPRDLV
jgi:putative CocE/NonD family hydrolase